MQTQAPLLDIKLPVVLQVKHLLIVSQVAHPGISQSQGMQKASFDVSLTKPDLQRQDLLSTESVKFLEPEQSVQFALLEPEQATHPGNAVP